MGALIHKHSDRYRTWELSAFETYNYLEFSSDYRITVYTTSNKAVRILSPYNWISDRIRYSYDGFHKQRLNSCFYQGKSVSWWYALSVLSELSIDSKIALHWSALEPKCFYDVYNFFYIIASEVAMPYSNYSDTEFIKNNNTKNVICYKWSLKDIAPLLEIDSQYSVCVKNSIERPTSLKQTETSPLTGDLNIFTLKQDVTSVFIQTEVLTSCSSSVYFGTHGFVNASKLNLVIPCLLTYERYNEYTGQPFIKGPSAARTYNEITTVLLQLYSLAVGNCCYKNDKSFNYKLLSKISLKDYCSTKITLSTFSFKRYLHFFNDNPELLVSDVQRCFIK